MREVTGLKFAFDVSPDFELGDIVMIRSGGPDMTVIDSCESCGGVEVAFCDSDGDVVFASFPTEALVYAPEDDDEED